jgi:hypothetical protein
MILLYKPFLKSCILPPFDALVGRIFHEKVIGRYDMVLRLMKKHCSFKSNDTPKHFMMAESGRLVIAITTTSLIIGSRNVESEK